MPLEINEIGNPVLREVAKDVSLEELKSAEVQSFIDDLIATKRKANGAGIAAPQVGRSLRIFVVEVGNNPRYPYMPNFPLTIVVNPTVSFNTNDFFENYEGCLSIPNLRGVVQRCTDITVKGCDRYGKKIDFNVKGVSAGTFQHEYDHLNGTLFLDRVKDTKTLCTWKEFSNQYEKDFIVNIKRIISEYGS